MFYVYILKSEKDKSFYIGYTNYVYKRLNEHNTTNKNCYTRSKRPWKVVYTQKFKNKSDAIKREREIKKKKKRSYILWLIGKC